MKNIQFMDKTALQLQCVTSFIQKFVETSNIQLQSNENQDNQMLRNQNYQQLSFLDQLPSPSPVFTTNLRSIAHQMRLQSILSAQMNNSQAFYIGEDKDYFSDDEIQEELSQSFHTEFI
ncbi:Hypothetical_protein [Hexamita inflata]|uniref:Hypothetical_protein n=1 Tax=Hexamita inflata TaxID=28002 RepID=A0AA86UFI7_9EUKA|nr:Hypothetical protein HINF_LOCUS41504 [Hexamita inflata]